MKTISPAIMPPSSKTCLAIDGTSKSLSIYTPVSMACPKDVDVHVVIVFRDVIPLNVLSMCSRYDDSHVDDRDMEASVDEIRREEARRYAHPPFPISNPYPTHISWYVVRGWLPGRIGRKRRIACDARPSVPRESVNEDVPFNPGIH